MESIIRVDKLSKSFTTKERKKGQKRKRTVQALKDVDLVVYEGENFGLLGPNGAGKTTLIKCLTTLLLPSEGTAWVNGYNIHKQEDSVRASLGCMLMGDRGLYWKLTGRENLDYFGALYHVPRDVRRKRIGELIDLLKLDEYADRTVETYSSGQKMLVAFAKALINDAPILFFDEPTVTMDVPTARELRRIVRSLNKDQGKTIVYTTHLMHEAEELCDRVAIIDRGEIIALGTPNDLKASLVREDVVQLEGVFPARTVDRLRATPGVRDVVVKAEGNGRTTLAVVCDNSRLLLPRIIEAVSGNGASLEYIKPQEVTLEDVFIAKTGRSLAIDTREVVKEAGKGGGGRG
ncbi:MAG TPA: ABC transporter ATP-binding protein [Thermoplasmata archaeon]|nr:ABC transporter ATP-binding protein [Thermoplasmata archaeon]